MSLVFLALVLFLFLVALWIRVHRLRPSNDRSWVNDNSRNATVKFEDEIVKIQNVRDFNWKTTKEYDEKWINQEYDLREVKAICSHSNTLIQSVIRWLTRFFRSNSMMEDI